jgi:hypothetical protein
VTVLLLSRARQGRANVLPSPDQVLAAGDRLVVLGSLDDLRRIELGRAVPPAWCLRIQGRPDATLRFDALQSLARHLGQAPGAMASLLNGEEHLTPPLDRDSAEGMAEELRRCGIRCRLEPQNTAS